MKVNYYDIICISDNKLVARFFDNNEALKTQKWLNEKFNIQYVKVEMREDELYFKKVYGVTFECFNDFKKFFEMQKENKNKFNYIPTTDGTAFVKVDNYWWEFDLQTPLNNATIYNRMGGRQTGLDLTNAIIVEAKDWNDLDWKGTVVYDDKYKTGWLSPQGEFFGCGYEYHVSQAMLVHNLTEREMENLGWIKLTCVRNNLNEIIAYLGYDKDYNRIIPTKEQMRYLCDSDIYNLDEIKFKIRLYRQNNINNKDQKER